MSAIDPRSLLDDPGDTAPSPALHRLQVEVPGVSGMGTRTFLDGQEIHGLTGVEVRIGMEEATSVVLRLQVQSVDVSAAALTTWYEAWTLDLDGTEHSTTAPTFTDALRELADDLDDRPHEHGRTS